MWVSTRACSEGDGFKGRLKSTKTIRNRRPTMQATCVCVIFLSTRGGGGPGAMRQHRGPRGPLRPKGDRRGAPPALRAGGRASGAGGRRRRPAQHWHDLPVPINQ